MTDITPPSELVQQWRKSGPADAAVNNAYECHIATCAAQWGADMELEACCEWMKRHLFSGLHLIKQLRAARRPKPPSLKEEAFLALEALLGPTKGGTNAETIRRALEQLDD